MVLASQRTLITIGCTRIVNQPVALALFVSDITFQLPVFLAVESHVARPPHIRRDGVLTDNEFFVCALDTFLDAATA